MPKSSSIITWTVLSPHHLLSGGLSRLVHFPQPAALKAVNIVGRELVAHKYEWRLAALTCHAAA